jgi:hypothetical protein
MLVLFDQGTPVPIRPFLKEHTVQATAERGWDTLENGELLKAAEAAGFDVLVSSCGGANQPKPGTACAFRAAPVVATVCQR